MAKQSIDPSVITARLMANPGFFERYADVLKQIRLKSPHGDQVVSLQERQAQIVREKVKALEAQAADLKRQGETATVIAGKLHRWSRYLFEIDKQREMPDEVIRTLAHEFSVPQVGIRLWGVRDRFLEHDFAEPVSSHVKVFASGIAQPYCGVNSGFEATSWLPDESTALSLALIPLRAAPRPGAFGMIILASPDPGRYRSDMSTALLARVGELAGALLSQLLPSDHSPD